eukprot:CAMPEP_0170325858 /NCGR_PEP_ID=MMETSP0116_2-20130129/63800_1 /TAXON_ID=400756 /ORGANISM="Durinskia baltica, Strain CSIRO CS-38" /LENGTH=31 /DNA_ID= /DNA_START= /DNA_END= /DNA_ORIENTATION=
MSISSNNATNGRGDTAAPARANAHKASMASG